MATENIEETQPSFLDAPFLERQLAIRGARASGPFLTKAGLGLIAYGSKQHPQQRVSHLMKRDTIGKSQKHKIPKGHRAATNLKSEMWGGNYERSPTANRYGGKSSRTKARSSSLVRLGTLLVIAGRVVPVLGYVYAFHTLSGSPSAETIYESGKSTHDRSFDLMFDGISTASDIAFRPEGPIETVASVALWSVLS